MASQRRSFSQMILILVVLSLGGHAFADELTLYFVKPPIELQWNTPSALTRSLQKAQEADSNSSIGHVAVKLDCEASAGADKVQILDGMSMSDSNEIMQALDQGRGLGVLVDNYSGVLHGDAYRTQIDDYSCQPQSLNDQGQSRLSFLKIKISPKTCQRIAQYHAQYRERGLDKVYGGLNTHPLRGPVRGAGCAVFAMSVLEIAGLYTDEFDQRWSREFRIPQRLIGTPESPVSLINIVLTGHQWATPREDGVSVKTQDPALMYQWVAEKIASHDPKYSVETLCRYSQGLSVDMSDVTTPETPFW